jgi:hypothetical protein
MVFQLNLDCPRKSPMPEDEILYHYTSIAGLNGIINSRKILIWGQV